MLVLTAALLALGVPSASAAIICVPSGTGCDHNRSLLQEAIDLAATTPAARDTIRMSAGNFTQNVVAGATNPVDIVGAGRERDGTVLFSSDRSPILDIRSPGSTVSNLRVEVERRPGDAETGLALRGEGVVADEITVAGDPTLFNAIGVLMAPRAILRNSSVQVPNSSSAITAEANTLIEDVPATGGTMIRTFGSGPPVVVRRLRSSGPSSYGIFAEAGVNVSDSLIRLFNANSIGLLSISSPGQGVVITANHVTVIGTGGLLFGDGIGASASANGAPAVVEVRDSLFHGLRADLQVFSTSAGAARVFISHSNFDPMKVDDSGSGDAEIIAGAGNLLADPGFVNSAAADYRLRPDSPLVDRGFPGEGSTTDVDGQPRPADGNGDGTAVRDIGAFEYQRPPPSTPTQTPAPAEADTSAPLFRILSKRLKLDRRGRVAVGLRGPDNETAVSSGSLGLRSVRGRRVLGRKSFSLQPSARTVIRVKLSPKKARRVRRVKKLRVVLSITARDSAGNTRTVRKRVTLRAPSKRR